ncbi:hypothetical protein NLI96_g8643 [Meripilus lineatus]|uniref:Endoplasmic oxidoreductin n=1 Tax=Meripilus lineatus TaxID=2056292 RepID=A0AAD5YAY5_9APHY|nr:hypothetical protein NLI96_g8643 [Physisporinus lineatus]
MFSRHLSLGAVLLLVSTSIAGNNPGQSFLADTLLRKGQVQNVLEHKPAKDPDCKQAPTGPIETTLCDYETVESYNDELFGKLHELVETPFFKYYRADLYRECPFWHENGLCMNKECVITTVDESEIPEKWRAAELSKVEMPSGEQRHEVEGCFYRDTDFCYLDDMSEGDYIDLTLNPERFTGYAGISAQRVWSSIYRENCFGLSESKISRKPDSMVDPDEEKICLEQRVYYKIISGLHASISTHICHQDMNRTTGEWGPNLQCFINRIAAYPERLQYIYFNTVLLLRAVARIGPYLSAYDYCGGTGSHEGDAETLAKLTRVIDIAKTVGKFDETSLFNGENANVLKEEFKEHFRNVTRIMDCVGCDKCRLWGKIQTQGVGTALKILFELDENALNPHLNSQLLSRSEVVALINTLHRFTESLSAVNDFRKLWAETDKQEEERLLSEVNKVLESGTSSTLPSSSSKPHAQQPLTPQVPPVSTPKPRHTHTANTPTSPSFLTQIQRWWQACKEGTVDCVRGLVAGIQDMLEALLGLFKLSGKDQIPHSEF